MCFGVTYLCRMLMMELHYNNQMDLLSLLFWEFLINFTWLTKWLSIDYPTWAVSSVYSAHVGPQCQAAGLCCLAHMYTSVFSARRLCCVVLLASYVHIGPQWQATVLCCAACLVCIVHIGLQCQATVLCCAACLVCIVHIGPQCQAAVLDCAACCAGLSSVAGSCAVLCCLPRMYTSVLSARRLCCAVLLASYDKLRSWHVHIGYTCGAVVISCVVTTDWLQT